MASAVDAVRRRMTALGLWDAHQRTPGEVVRSLLAMQAQEHRYARWSVAQRSGPVVATAPEVDAAFDAGDLLRTHVLRPTWHFVSPRDLRWLMRFSGPRVHARNARRYHELELDEHTLRRGAEVMADAVADAGPLTRPALAAVLEDAGISCGGQRIAYLLMHAELTSVLCSGPMEGKQHTYARFEDRVDAKTGPDGDEALAELARRYFTTRGPATVKDLAWWAGLRMPEARAATELVRHDLEELEVDGCRCWAGEGPKGTGGPAPRADLVQCYDEVIISYSESRLVLRTAEVAFDVPQHLDGFTHVVLLEGRLLGHWRITPADVEVRLARGVDARERRAVEDAVAELRAWT